MGQITQRNYDEIFMLVTALEWVLNGRILEVADILSSRLRCLAFGIETGKIDVAVQFLSYARQDQQLVNNQMVSVALDLHKAELKRAKALASAGRQSLR